jgi:hypothetical protein
MVRRGEAERGGYLFHEFSDQWRSRVDAALWGDTEPIADLPRSYMFIVTVEQPAERPRAMRVSGYAPAPWKR